MNKLFWILIGAVGIVAIFLICGFISAISIIINFKKNDVEYICPNCDKQWWDYYANYCPECGTKLISESEYKR